MAGSGLASTAFFSGFFSTGGFSSGSEAEVASQLESVEAEAALVEGAESRRSSRFSSAVHRFLERSNSTAGF